MCLFLFALCVWALGREAEKEKKNEEGGRMTGSSDVEMASGFRLDSGKNILLDIRPGQTEAGISGPLIV